MTNNYTISKNEKFNSYEILFTEKPAAATLELLKANNYRWNPYKKIWYGYSDIAALLDGKENQKVETVKAATASNKISDDLLKEYEKRLESVWNNESMVKWSLKQASSIVKLESGKLFIIDKKNLQKHFCFGYGLNGVTDSESENRAFNSAAYARSNGDYFKSENLSEYKNIIECYKKRLKNNENLYAYNAYINYSEKPQNIVSITTEESLNSGYYSRLKTDFEPLTKTDIQNVIAAYETEYKKLEKRCDNYLKKYGTEKLHVWTYLVD